MSEIEEIRKLFTAPNGLLYTAETDTCHPVLNDHTGKTVAFSASPYNRSLWQVTGYDTVVIYKVPDNSVNSLVFPRAEEIEELKVSQGGVCPSILETESIYTVTDAAISEATSKLKAPLEDINTSETILEGILRILGEEVNDAPQLRYFIQALEGEKDSVLGEINAYRDAHARVMTNWWSTLIAADPSHSSLALRATFDMDKLGNLNESSYVAWWAENVLPWLKQHGEFFNHEVVEAQTQAILAEVAANQSVGEDKH